jgi:hypothetical protein
MTAMELMISIYQILTFLKLNNLYFFNMKFQNNLQVLKVDLKNIFHFGEKYNVIHLFWIL